MHTWVIIVQILLQFLKNYCWNYLSVKHSKSNFYFWETAIRAFVMWASLKIKKSKIRLTETHNHGYDMVYPRVLLKMRTLTQVLCQLTCCLSSVFPSKISLQDQRSFKVKSV